MFRPAVIHERGEWYRFLSAGFIHADWMHLLFNMYVLYAFGEYVEGAYEAVFGPFEGKVLYLVLYLMGIAAASIPSYYQHQGNYTYAALGASGAVSGIVFAFIFFSPWAMLSLFFFIPMPAILFGIGYLWYSNYMAKRNLDNIGHDAHFWGGVFGFLFTIVAAAVIQPALISNFLSQLYDGLIFMR